MTTHVKPSASGRILKSRKIRAALPELAAMVANGAKPNELVAHTGCTRRDLKEFRHRHKAEWKAAIEAAGGKYGASPFRQLLPKIAALIVQGMTVEAAAVQLRCPVLSIIGYRNKHKAEWNTLLEEARKPKPEPIRSEQPDAACLVKAITLARPGKKQAAEKPTLDMPLLDYVQHHYRGIKRQGKNPRRKTMKSRERLCRMLAERLGRPALVGDLNADSFACIEGPCNRYQFLSIWRCAARAGIVRIEAENASKWPRRGEIRARPPGCDCPSPEMRLIDFVEWFYVTPPRFKHKTAGRHLVLCLRRCCRALKEVLGRDPLLSDLSEQNLGAAITRLEANGWTEKTIKNHGMHVIAVWRYAADMGVILLPWQLRRTQSRVVNHHPQDERRPFPLVNAPHTLFGFYCRVFLVQRDRLAEGTMHQYRIALRDFCCFLGRQATLADLNDDTVREWKNRMQQRVDRGEIASITLSERMGRIITLWNWAGRKRKSTGVEELPTVKRPPAPDPIPIAIDFAELCRLFEAARKECGLIAGIPAAHWWEAWLAFVFWTAERKAAGLALRWAWIDVGKLTATIPAAFRKGKRKNAIYHLCPEVMALLERIRKPERELVFPWVKDDAIYYKHFGRIAVNAGLPNDRKHKTHLLRATHATMKAVLGGDPTKSLIHTDGATTRRHYIDPTHLPPDTTQLPMPWQSVTPAVAQSPADVIAIDVPPSEASKLPRARVLKGNAA